MLLKYLGPAVLGLSLLSWSCNNLESVPLVYTPDLVFDAQPKRVLIVSFDGLRPDAISPARAEHIQSVAAAGVSATGAHTILPSITLPSHTSMLTGVTPEKHGIFWNNWDPSKGLVQVPTLFDEAKKQGLRTAMIVGKEKFRHLNHPGSVDDFVLETGDPSAIARAAIGVIHDQQPQLLFVHFAHPDNVGHKHGWMTSDQLEAIDEADTGLGRILQSLKNQGLLASTAVIVTADHGGKGSTHGDASEESTSIPWFAVGAGVGAHRTIGSPVTTYDTAATAAKLLAVPVPANWDGKTVL